MGAANLFCGVSHVPFSGPLEFVTGPIAKEVPSNACAAMGTEDAGSITWDESVICPSVSAEFLRESAPTSKSKSLNGAKLRLKFCSVKGQCLPIASTWQLLSVSIPKISTVTLVVDVL